MIVMPRALRPRLQNSSSETAGVFDFFYSFLGPNPLRVCRDSPSWRLSFASSCEACIALWLFLPFPSVLAFCGEAVGAFS